jgi:hypothetical protein
MRRLVQGGREVVSRPFFANSASFFQPWPEGEHSSNDFSRDERVRGLPLVPFGLHWVAKNRLQGGSSHVGSFVSQVVASRLSHRKRSTGCRLGDGQGSSSSSSSSGAGVLDFYIMVLT